MLASMFVSACSPNPPSEPSCRVNAQHASSHQRAGACIVRMNNKLLVTQLSNGLFDLPSQRTNSNMGEMIKSAQCLAHQAMWQQTGFNVEVQQVVGAQADGTWLFACTINAGFDGTEPPFDAPKWNAANVNKIAFIDPFEIELQNWANRQQFIVVRDAYVVQGIYLNSLDKP